MADYDCFPLWDASPGRVGNIDPESLPISPQLKADLMAWATVFDRTLNRDDPLNSGFVNDCAKEAFKAQGRALAERLQAELGLDFEVKIKV